MQAYVLDRKKVDQVRSAFALAFTWWHVLYYGTTGRGTQVDLCSQKTDISIQES